MNPLGLGYLRIMGNRNDCDMISDSKWSACDDVARAGESLWCSHQVAEPNRLRHTPVTYAVWFTSTRCRYCFTLEEHGRITVFLSRFGSFLRSESKFSKLPVQSSHQCVTCAHEKNSFSVIWTRCKCFGTSMHMIMYNSLLFPTLSIAYVMLIKMYCNGLYGIASPPQRLGISSLHKSLHAKWLLFCYFF